VSANILLGAARGSKQTPLINARQSAMIRVLLIIPTDGQSSDDHQP
jgi:hypothetical protein